jgi:hypothetical protein
MVMASQGDHPAMIRTADKEAPNVIDPSTVISVNLIMRKLINIPNESNERISPIVKAPIIKFIVKPPY